MKLEESLVKAAQEGDVAKVNKLLAEGADPNYGDERDDYSCMQPRRVMSASLQRS